ncbi:MAG TPA: hypothetical protein DIT77_12915 [Marinobacter hydrocarbonoclasticus]|nr:hypothetical protein [Marinobacter nauticus]
MRHEAVIFLDICARGNGPKVVERPTFRCRRGVPLAGRLVYRELVNDASYPAAALRLCQQPCGKQVFTNNLIKIIPKNYMSPSYTQ